VVKDGHPIAIKSVGNGNTEEDKAVASVVEVSFKQCLTISKGKGKGKQCPTIGKSKRKGKQCDQGKHTLGPDQQSYCEYCLQTTVGLLADPNFFRVIFSTLQ
jgi:hypothetical protein